MLTLLQKIIKTKVVTEGYDSSPVPSRFRGGIEAKDAACDACGRCAAVCPSQALSVENGRCLVDNRACLFCGRCVEVCENQALAHSSHYKLAELQGAFAETAGEALKKSIRQTLGRSLHIRHVDVGSCNACDFEMNALSNPIYDLQQYGIDFVASPRHADMLMVTGVVTRNLTQALLMTYEATPSPKLVMAVGACAAGGQTFGSTYAIRGSVDSLIPVDIYVPGCPPRPQALLYGLLLAVGRL